MPKVLIADALSNLANEVFKKNNIEVDTIIDLKPDELKKIISYNTCFDPMEKLVYLRTFSNYGY